MARPRRCQRKKICAKRALVGSAIFPKLTSRFPIRAQTFVVRYRVLDNESFSPFRMSQGHAKTNGAAIILHVKSVVGKPECFGEVIHDRGNMIECVREFCRIRPVAVS